MSANEKAVENKPDHKAKRHRSPAFPFISIDDAITRLRLIFQRDRRAWTTAEAILSHLNYKGSARSGTAGRVIAALKQYGLLDENAGQFRVSDVGFRILHLPEDSDERPRLVREVALAPPMFQRLLTHYQGELPSDAALKSHLILHEKFNPDSVDHFIRVFRQTVNVANPLAEDYTGGEELAETQLPFTGGTPAMQQPSARMAGQQHRQIQLTDLQGKPLEFGKQDHRKQTELAFKLSRESEARITIYGDASQEAIEKLAALLELQKDTFPTKAELELPKETPKHSIDELDGAFGEEEENK